MAILLALSITPEDAFQQLVAAFGEVEVRRRMREWKSAHAEQRDDRAVVGIWHHWQRSTKGAP